MDTIKFSNGEIHSCSFLSTIPQETSSAAYIALDDVGFTEAAALFADSEKTSTMEYGEYRLVGYTKLNGLYVQPYGIQAVLTGGHDERIS